MFPWLGAGAAVVIIAFGIVAFTGSQRANPSTGFDAGQVALNPTGSASATASSTATATASPSATASRVSQPAASAAPATGHGVLMDRSLPAGNPTWESPAFKAPTVWTISYAYDCGGYGGHFTVAVFSDTLQASPVQKRGDKSSGSVTVQGGGTVTLAIDTTKDCAWHVTARG